MSALHLAVRIGTTLAGMTALAIGATVVAVIKYAAGDSRGNRSLI